VASICTSLKEMTMNVKDLMTKNPVTCLPTAKLNEVAKLMDENDCGEIPVIRSKDKPELVGVITDRDICCRAVAQGKNPSSVAVSECMSSPVFTVTPDADIAKTCKTFEEKEVRRLPVVDKSNHVVGILSLADIAERAPEQYAKEILRHAGKASGATGAAAH
jgi:CBS domain-containing protein